MGWEWLLQWNVCPPYSNSPVQVIVVFASMIPSSSAAIALSTLKVEPGSYTPKVARLNSGERASSFRASASST